MPDAVPPPRQQLKTGNPTVDMALCMLVPAIFAWIFTTWETTIKPAYLKAWQKWTDRLAAREYCRNIEFVAGGSACLSLLACLPAICRPASPYAGLTSRVPTCGFTSADDAGADFPYATRRRYELMRNSWGSVLTGQEERNNVLQKAITLCVCACSVLRPVLPRRTKDKDAMPPSPSAFAPPAHSTCTAHFT